MFLGGFCRFLPFYDRCWCASGFCPRLLSSPSTLVPSMMSRFTSSVPRFPLCSRLVSSVDHLTLPGVCHGPLHLTSEGNTTNPFSSLNMPPSAQVLNPDRGRHLICPFLPSTSHYTTSPRAIYSSSPLPRSWFKAPSLSPGRLP